MRASLIVIAMPASLPYDAALGAPITYKFLLSILRCSRLNIAHLGYVDSAFE
jgi:hypothetical protein